MSTPPSSQGLGLVTICPTVCIIEGDHGIRIATSEKPNFAHWVEQNLAAQRPIAA